MKKNLVNQWYFWLIIIVAALGIGFGVSYLTGNNDSDDKETEKSEKKKKNDKKEESDNPFVGTWYLPASEGIITIKFKENGECTYSQGKSSIKCSYEYDDEKVTINNEEKKTDPIVSQYSIGKGYIDFSGEKMYTDKSMAEKDMDKYYSGKSNNGSTTTKKTYDAGQRFRFNDLEVTVGTKYKFDTVKNEYSTYNGKTAIGIPVTVKNLKKEDQNLSVYFCTVNGPKGTMSTSVDMFFEDNFAYADKLKTGDYTTKYLYVLYEGDGKYTIEFNNYSEDITVELDVKK